MISLKASLDALPIGKTICDLINASDGFTLIQRAVFHNNNQAFDLVMKYIKNIKNRNTISQWINKASEPD